MKQDKPSQASRSQTPNQKPSIKEQLKGNNQRAKSSRQLFRTFLGHTPSTAGTFRKEFRKNSGKTPETLSERFLEFPSRVRLGSPKPYNSRHLKAPEHFQNQYGWGRLSEPVMEFPAVLGVFLIFGTLPHIFTLFQSFFQNFPPGLSL